jgi:hypothetical protein
MPLRLALAALATACSPPATTTDGGIDAPTDGPQSTLTTSTMCDLGSMCGAPLEGRWLLASECLTSPTLASCPDWTWRASGSVMGSIEFLSSGHFVQDIHERVDNFSGVASCGCAELQSAAQMINGGIRCSPLDDTHCACGVETSATGSGDSGTFTVQGDVITLQGRGQYHFCASADRLRLWPTTDMGVPINVWTFTRDTRDQ